MADDLLERVRKGNFEAIADPSLMLHLFEQPSAAWWWEGASTAADLLVLVYLALAPAQEALALTEAWVLRFGGQQTPADATCDLARARAIKTDPYLTQAIRRLARALPIEQRARALAGLAVELRRLVPAQQHHHDPTLEMLRLFAAP